MALVKTTVEIPGRTLRRAKVFALSRGITLNQFFTQAVEDKLETAAAPSKKPMWIKLGGVVGKTGSAIAETRRIQRRIDTEFEIDAGYRTERPAIRRKSH